MDRRSFFLKTLKATAAGILVPEHLLKGRSMVSLCGIDLYYSGPDFWFIVPFSYEATLAQLTLNLMQRKMMK